MKRFLFHTFISLICSALLSSFFFYSLSKTTTLTIPLRPILMTAEATDILPVTNFTAEVKTVIEKKRVKIKKSKNNHKKIAVKKLNTKNPRVVIYNYLVNDKNKLIKSSLEKFVKITPEYNPPTVNLESPKYHEEKSQNKVETTSKQYPGFEIKKPRIFVGGVEGEPLKLVSWSSYFDKQNLVAELKKIEKETTKVALQENKPNETEGPVAKLALSSDSVNTISSKSIDVVVDKVKAPSSGDEVTKQAVTTHQADHLVMTSGPIEPERLSSAIEEELAVEHDQAAPLNNEQKSPFYPKNISTRVANAIYREMGGKKVNTQVEYSRPKSKVRHDKIDYSAAAPQRGTDVSPSSFVESEVPTKRENSNPILVKAMSYRFQIGEEESVTDFELWPLAGANERVHDDNTGIINLEVNRDESIFGATLVSPGYVKTRFSMNLLKDAKEFVIPLIKVEELEKMAEKEQIAIDGGAILVDRDDGINAVDINIAYTAKVFLDEKWTISNREEGQRFVLYLGLSPGRAILSYRTDENEILRKEVWIKESEITYDFNFVLENKKSNMALLGVNLLGSDPYPLNFDESNVKTYLSKSGSKKINLNLYEIASSKKLSGTETFLNISGEEEELFVAQKSLGLTAMILDREALKRIVNDFGYDKKMMGCLVQIDLNRKIKSFEVFAEGINMEEEVQKQFWTKEGDVSQYFEPNANRILMHTNSSEVSYQIEHYDGTKEYSTFICSANRYMIFSH